MQTANRRKDRDRFAPDDSMAMMADL